MNDYLMPNSLNDFVLFAYVNVCGSIEDVNMDAKYMISKATMIRSFWLCQQQLILPFVPESLSTCSECGPCPSRLVGDGVSIGIFRNKLVRRYFNSYEGQLGPPMITLSDERRALLTFLREKEPGYLILRSKPWSDLCVFSGANCGVGESIVGFATGSTQKKKGAPIEDFTLARALHLKNCLISSHSPECEAIRYLVVQYVDVLHMAHIGVDKKHLRDMVQSFGAKSVAPICGVHGPCLTYALSQLAFGMSASKTKVPPVLFELVNYEELSRAEAIRYRQGLQALDITFSEEEEKAFISVSEPWVQPEPLGTASLADKFSWDTASRTMNTMKALFRKQPSDSGIRHILLVSVQCVHVMRDCHYQ
mgnify:CR=1 FL=1